MEGGGEEGEIDRDGERLTEVEAGGGRLREVEGSVGTQSRRWISW